MVAPLDGRFGRTMDIPKMLAGRLPGQDAPQEIAVDQIGAQQLHLHVGSVLRMVGDGQPRTTPACSPSTSSASS